MKLQKHTLFIGLADKDTKKQEVTTTRAKEIIAKVFGDCTISDATGIYTHQDGSNKQVKEKTLRVELLFKKDKEVIENIKTVKALLNQETVCLEKQLVNSNLI